MRKYRHGGRGAQDHTRGVCVCRGRPTSEQQRGRVVEHLAQHLVRSFLRRALKNPAWTRKRIPFHSVRPPWLHWRPSTLQHNQHLRCIWYLMTFALKPMPAECKKHDARIVRRAIALANETC
jgi:hypothetical protein